MTPVFCFFYKGALKTSIKAGFSLISHACMHKKVHVQNSLILFSHTKHAIICMQTWKDKLEFTWKQMQRGGKTRENLYMEEFVRGRAKKKGQEQAHFLPQIES